jgi:hypothetical protein
MGNALKKIIAELNENLIKEYKTDKQLFKELTEVQSDLGLLYDDRPTCPFLRPHFLSRKQYDEIAHAAETIAEAAKRLTYAALEDEKLLERFDLTEQEERLAKINPGYEKICVSSRLDTFVAGENFKFLEYNAETPAGVGDQMQLEKVLEKIPLTKDFLANNKHWRPKPHQKLLQSLFTSYREFGGKKSKPNIAIVDWEGVSTEAEFFILKDYFESMGFPTLIADPSELDYNGKNLHAGSFEIDIFYKRVIIHELLEKIDETHPIIQSYIDGNLCMANSFRVKIPHKKMGFAIFTDEKYAEIFTDEQLEIIKTHIPWTRKVEETKTKFHNEKIDLIEYLQNNRERFLLKPNDDYGGKGIVLGWEVEQAEWETAIGEALQDSFIVQEKADIEKQEFPVYGEKVTLKNLLVDFDPFLFQNKTEGGLVRLSSSSLVNITQGGGQTALIILENL